MTASTTELPDLQAHHEDSIPEVASARPRGLRGFFAALISPKSGGAQLTGKVMVHDPVAWDRVLSEMTGPRDRRAAVKTTAGVDRAQDATSLSAAR